MSRKKGKKSLARSVSFSLSMLLVLILFAILALTQMKDGKKTKEYTLAEFQALEIAEQEAFVESFESVEAFEKWLQSVSGDDESLNVEYPWDNGGKQPEEYTLAEFQALEIAEQEAFVESFESIEAFEKWRWRVSEETEKDDKSYPWNNGGKQPAEYTLEEFEALEIAEQEAFVESFSDIDTFEEWRESVGQK